MPIYEYRCASCHKTSEVLQKISDPHPDTCPHCQAKASLTKLVSQTAFVLKGGGWYSDAYSSTSNKAASGSSSPSSSTAAPEAAPKPTTPAKADKE